MVTWVSLRKFCGENKIKILKIFLDLDNYEQKGVEVEALWRTFSKTLLNSYNQELLPIRKEPPHSSGATALQSSGLGPFGRIWLYLYYYHYCIVIITVSSSCKPTIAPRHHPCLWEYSLTWFPGVSLLKTRFLPWLVKFSYCISLRCFSRNWNHTIEFERFLIKWRKTRTKVIPQTERIQLYRM